MAMLFSSAPRIFNFAARRETLALSLAAVAAVSAFAYGHRSEPTRLAPVAQEWTGHLTPAASSITVQSEPMRSSSLVVSKSALTLPPLEAKPVVRAKNSCDSADRQCMVRPLPTIAVPPRRQLAVIDPQAAFLQSALLPPGLIPVPEKTSHVTRPVSVESKGFSLNPLNHVPDMSAIGRPFAAAGQAVSGWFKRP